MTKKEWEKIKKQIYPINYNGKVYQYEDCDSIFQNLYFSISSLNWDNGVYIGDGSWVYPDGTMEHDPNR